MVKRVVIRNLFQNPAVDSSAGFTLIELLVVVLIIGILSAVALPQYTKAVEKSRAAGVIQKVKSLQNAVDMYLLSNGYPSALTNLSSKSGLENLDVSFQANGTMKRSGLHAPSYMVFEDYYFYVVCESYVCYIIVEDNKPYSEQLVRCSWKRYNNSKYHPIDTWNMGECKYKSGSASAKSICEYFKQHSLLSNNNWSLATK